MGDLLAFGLQIQESMIRVIADVQGAMFKPSKAGVVIEKWHSCAAVRGDNRANVLMVTSAR